MAHCSLTCPAAIIAAAAAAAGDAVEKTETPADSLDKGFVVTFGPARQTKLDDHTVILILTALHLSGGTK